MSGIYSKSDFDVLVKRIGQIHASSKATWGKMNAGQMLAHCQRPFDVIFGDLKMKRGLVGMLFGKMAKKSMVGDKPFQKNLPTAKKFLVRDDHHVEEEKQKLIGKMARFVAIEKESLKAYKHPFFGKMTGDEWDILMYKHLDHHLSQFGV